MLVPLLHALGTVLLPSLVCSNACAAMCECHLHKSTAASLLSTVMRLVPELRLNWLSKVQVELCLLCCTSLQSPW